MYLVKLDNVVTVLEADRRVPTAADVLDKIHVSYLPKIRYKMV
jgi:hypothetical protein